ncbi:MAG: murein hydrolase activator EnvC family protein [Pseudobdellovibrio sp.]
MIKIFFILFFILCTAGADESDMLAGLEQKINSSLQEKAQLSVERQELEQQITELQTKIKERKQTIVLRLKALSRIRRFQWGELLLNNNLNNLNRDLKILRNLNQFDYELFKEYNGSLRMLAVARKNLSETDLQIQNNIKIFQRHLDEFKKLEEVQVNRLVNNKQDSLLLSKGHLSRPLDGKLKQEFGNVRDQFGQYYLLNRGELYEAPKNTFVKSVGPGVIIFRDELNRWRETLIVQHSDNYYSVYAGVRDAKKNVGDSVRVNEILGTNSANEFYFELRHFGNPINPKKWYEEQK